MATSTREIPREEWRAYFDDFSRDLPDLHATVEVAGREIGAQVEAERPLLTGITYDRGDDIVVIGLDAPGGIQEDLEHIVYHPQKIYVAEEDGERIFDIEDAEQLQTLVRLEPAK
ncbi:MAG TPA: DUF5335 family protein [Solirubrobacteraceae bacterium]|jgi:hypothetical protein|nr:DUF5335 family protein [Solirubrobacteraceae bacterium]